ncbi:phenylalanine--tRNA ligase subunit alpha [Candidatus Pacearchaeota archaeon]|nr:phenylalanine--tRNA ligase subunit alpha [Candidatus Pacearchaeota archaeon]MCK5149520.1 phenylalanine--tRNA ligase subunit alpha [Candidatus Pacearchaeota archaeon]
MNIQKIIESLSPHERKILPYLKEKNISEICEKSELDKTSVLRALEYLKNKGIVELSFEKKKIIELGVNGALYKKKGLPERRLMNLLDNKKILNMEEAQKQSSLSNEEFKASLGALKKKAIIELKNQKIMLNTNKEEIAKKTLEEQFIEILPTEYESLSPEQLYAIKSLQNRKDIIQIKEEKQATIKITELGKEISNSKIKNENSIEQITPKILKKESLWKGKKFRRYDVTSPVPLINGGKQHFVNQSLDYARKIWTEMGFQEMTGNIIDTGFWVFDALFTPQDHPGREMQDTFFINKKAELPDKKLVNAVRDAHEKGVGGSKGWQYKWDEEVAKKMVLRSHTTNLSAKTLAKLKKEDLPAKFFALGKVLRNETVDWSHGFEFYQTEGIVVDENANFRHLLGYLKQFYTKMGFEKIRFAPAYFPYTEPSVEIHVWHPEKKVWLELGGAGIFRPEISIPLLGKKVPILAWGQGFDRIIMDYYKIKDLRELYKNDLTKLRKMKHWMK